MALVSAVGGEAAAWVEGVETTPGEILLREGRSRGYSTPTEHVRPGSEFNSTSLPRDRASSPLPQDTRRQTSKGFCFLPRDGPPMALVLCCSAGFGSAMMQPCAVPAPAVVAAALAPTPLARGQRPSHLHLLQMHPVPTQQQQRTAQPCMKLKDRGMRARRSPLRPAVKGRVIPTRTQQQQPTLKAAATNPLSAGSQFLSGVTSVSNVVINEALLVCVLALTAYAVLTVDSEAWRGCEPPPPRGPRCLLSAACCPLP